MKLLKESHKNTLRMLTPEIVQFYECLNTYGVHDTTKSTVVVRQLPKKD